MNKFKISFYMLFGFVFLMTGSGFAQENHAHDHDTHAGEASGHDSHDDDRDHEGHEGHEGHEEESGHGHDEARVQVSRDMQQAIGLAFEAAQTRAFEEKIKVYGEIAQDTDRYAHITSNGAGTVKDIYVEVGGIVDADDPILSITDDEGKPENITAPHHGMVMSVHVRPGEKVDHLKSLASLIDLDILRVSFDVYEKDLRYVSVGQSVNVYSTAYPDEVFKGKVVFVSPRIDKDSQTIKIRAEVNNDDHLLRLGMSVTGDLIFSTGGEVLSVSQAAVQQIDDETVVFIREGDKFTPIEINPGREFGDYREVLSGLNAGQEVVSKGSFALKSELQKGAFGDGHNH